jgi:spore maturation protein CgeB
MSMNLLEKNLTLLERSAPQAAEVLRRTVVPPDHRLAPSKKGPPYLEVAGRTLHSTYDPVQEGREWHRTHAASAGPVVIFGLGLGYHVLPFLEGEQQVWVVEPSPAVARLALAHHDFERLLAQGGLCLGEDFSPLPRQARLLVHVPSRRLHPGACRRLTAYLAGEDETPGWVRLLVVGPLYGGSHPIARYCSRAFRELGHQVEFLDFAPFYPGYQALKQISRDQAVLGRLTGDCLKFLGEILLAKVREFRPDLVFFLAQAPVEPPLLRRLKGEGPLLAYWFVEDFQVFPYWRDVAPEVDVFFTLQREPWLTEVSRLGGAKAAFLPLAADPEVYRPLLLTPEEQKRYGAAVSFVGAGYLNRREFFQGLLDFDFKIWGSDWQLNSPLGPYIQNQGARVSEEESVKIFNASRINLNLHSSPYHLGINPEGDYLNPRVFDLAAAGAFQLVDRRAQLAEFFVPEVEVATFGSLAEAREKIDFFLAHEDRRREVAAAGRARLLQEHTYTVRLSQALELIHELLPGRLPRRPPPVRPLERLRRGLPSSHPVQAILARLPAECDDLGQIVALLQEGRAPLTEAEAILWLVLEFQQGLGRGRF